MDGIVIDSSTLPINSAAWQALRASVLSDEPLCRACKTRGQVVPATDVDHIVPRAQGGTDARENLQPLCHSCHSRKTAREDGGFGHGGEAKPVGCDVAGMPTDPRHPWNTEGAA